jgi:hypothetical protein
MTSVGFTQCHPQGLNWPKSSALFWDFNHPRMGGYGLHWVAHINTFFFGKIYWYQGYQPTILLFTKVVMIP